MANDLEMERPDPLGHFEQLLLTAVLDLGGESYGMPILDRVTELAEKRINQGAFYTTLDRMEKKGLLESRLSDPTKETRGQSKRYYRLTPLGLRTLGESLKNAKRLAEIFDNHYGRIRRWMHQKLKIPKPAPRRA